MVLVPTDSEHLYAGIFRLEDSDRRYVLNSVLTYQHSRCYQCEKLKCHQRYVRK